MRRGARASMWLGGLVLLSTVSGCSSLRYKTTEELWAEGDGNFDRAQYDDAVPYYDELLRRETAEREALLKRGISHERTGDAADALVDYSRAAEGGEVRALLYRANLNIKRGDTASAEQDLGQLRSMGLSGRERVIHLTLLGTLRLQQGQLRLAAQSLEQAIQAGAGYGDPMGRRHVADAHVNASQAYYRMGDFGRAYGHYVAYVGAAGGGQPLSEHDLARGSTVILSGEDYYMLGLLAYLAGDFDAANAHLARADEDMVSQAAEILDDPSFGRSRRRGLK